MPTRPIPSYYTTPEARYDEACLATQHKHVLGNDALAQLLHLVADPGCAHCANYPSRHNVESAWELLIIVIDASRKGYRKV